MSAKSGSEVSPDIDPVPIGDDSFRLTKSVKKSHKRYRKHKPSVGDDIGGTVSRSRSSGEPREEKRDRSSGRSNRGDDSGRTREGRRHGGDERSFRDKGRDLRRNIERERMKRREERFHVGGVEPRRSPRSRYDHHHRPSGYRSREGPGGEYRGEVDSRKRRGQGYRRREPSESNSESEEDRHRKRPRKQPDESESVYVRSLIHDLADSRSSSSSSSSSSSESSDSEGTPRTRHTPRRGRGHSSSESPEDMSQGESGTKIKSWKDISETSSGEESGIDSDSKTKVDNVDAKFSQMSENFLKYSEAVSSSEMEDNEDKTRPPTSDHTPSGQPSQDKVIDTTGEQQHGEDDGGDNVEKMEEEGEDEGLPPYLPALMGCRSVECFEWLNKIEEGTYGVVFRAKEKRTGEVVALKKLKMEKEREGFPITSLREINMLLKASHPNIVHVREIVVGSNMDKIYIVMDYVEHDLKSLMEVMKQPFLEGEVKTLMIQLLRAVHHMHDNWILHRDLKTSNLLLSHKGILKVADFGLAREYGSPLKKYTPVVVTLWYRCPELLLGAKEYSTAVDVWSVGCIFAELLNHKPLFMGKSEIDQLNQIFKELGTPSNDIWPGYSELPVAKKVSFSNQPMNNLRKRFPVITNTGFNLLNKLLTYDPKRRITAEEGLLHTYFEESPLPVDPSMFPTWPAKSEMVKKVRQRSPSAPEGGAFLLNKLKEKDDPEEAKFSAQAANKGSGFTLKF